ncbi:SHOCT domain-containing protein [Microbacterium sp. M]|uniref:SHOCT domain-containing protein n=1 Tax=Microbacterium sp. M TaxID=3377125 RepID=UPI0038668A3E
MPLRRFGRPGLIGLAARTAVVAGTASAVSGGMARNQQAKAQSQYEQQQYEAAQQQAQIDAAAQAAASQYAAPAAAPAVPAAPAPAGNDMLAQLQQLAGLKDAGVLSDEEFAAAKAKLLS